MSFGPLRRFPIACAALWTVAFSMAPALADTPPQRGDVVVGKGDRKFVSRLVADGRRTPEANQLHLYPGSQARGDLLRVVANRSIPRATLARMVRNPSIGDLTTAMRALKQLDGRGSGTTPGLKAWADALAAAESPADAEALVYFADVVAARRNREGVTAIHGTDAGLFVAELGDADRTLVIAQVLPPTESELARVKGALSRFDLAQHRLELRGARKLRPGETQRLRQALASARGVRTFTQPVRPVGNILERLRRRVVARRAERAEVGTALRAVDAELAALSGNAASAPAQEPQRRADRAPAAYRSLMEEAAALHREAEAVAAEVSAKRVRLKAARERVATLRGGRELAGGRKAPARSARAGRSRLKRLAPAAGKSGGTGARARVRGRPSLRQDRQRKVRKARRQRGKRAARGKR